MAIEKDRALSGPLRTLFNMGAVGDWTDGQLLERFATDRGEPAELAFAALVERHGPMVLRVCRGVLADPDDAQDAFQATFLVLVRKARGLWVRDSLGPWLHQVAYRTASCTRSARLRRRRFEGRAARALVSSPGPDAELGRVLHEEIGRLPGRFREPLVLCDLGGRTHEQAARQLGWPVGTVKSRISRGRDRLRHRLVRRGFAPVAGLFAASGPIGVEASISPELLNATIGAPARAATTSGVVAGPVARLAEEVVRAMLLKSIWKAAAVLLALAATSSGVYLVAQEGASADDPQPAADALATRTEEVPVAEAVRGEIRVIVSERGHVEPARSAQANCEVAGQTTILSILPEGTRVTKGQLVCELDSAALEDALINQRITTQQAEARHKNAELSLEVAKIKIIEYLEGTYRMERATIEGEAALAEASLHRAEDRLKRLRRARERLDALLAAQGRTESAYKIVVDLDLTDRLEAEEMAIRREEFLIERAETKRKLLEGYTKDKTVKELQSEVAKAEADERSQAAGAELKRAKGRKLEDQIKKCKLYAAGDGPVIYANNPAPLGGARPNIEAGATVRERQILFTIPDLSEFRVNVKVPEAIVHLLKRAQPAQVRVDAFPDEVLTGVVEAVAPLPDPTVFDQRGTKIYSTLVKLEDGHAGLRPGMTAQAEVVTKEVNDVVRVPVRAVLIGKDKRGRPQNRYYVEVRKPGGGFEFREVTLGATDEKVIEVKEGLEPGDAVALDPYPLLSEEEKREVLKPTPPDAVSGR